MLLREVTLKIETFVSLSIEIFLTFPVSIQLETIIFMRLMHAGGLFGVKVLGKLSVSGRPTGLMNSRARACCSCTGCGWGLFGHFFSCLTFLFSFSLSGKRPNID